MSLLHNLLLTRTLAELSFMHGRCTDAAEYEPLLRRLKNALGCRWPIFRSYEQEDYSELIDALFNQLLGEFAYANDVLRARSDLPTLVDRHSQPDYRQTNGKHDSVSSARRRRAPCTDGVLGGSVCG
jgi:hypothetical protein